LRLSLFSDIDQIRNEDEIWSKKFTELPSFYYNGCERFIFTKFAIRDRLR
jgi:hypothetical protein